MAYSSEQFFTDEEIRDIAEHKSNMVYAGAFIPKTIIFINSTDANIDIEVFGCSKTQPDIGYHINSITITIPAESNQFETLEDYFQCFFLKVKAQSIPTTGNFNSEMLMTSGG